MGVSVTISQRSGIAVGLNNSRGIVVSSPAQGPAGPPGSGGGGLTANLVTADTTLAGGNQYSIQKPAGLCLLPLPATCAFGELIEIDGHSAGGWEVDQGIGQSILNSGATSTAGVGHGIKSTYASDSIRLRCIITNTVFQVVSSSGLPNFF